MQSTSIKPAGHHLVVAPVKLPEKSKGGIIVNLEGSQWERLEKAGRMIGVVIAIGPQAWKAHAANLAGYGESGSTMYDDWAKVGDTILYSRHAGKYVFDPMDVEKRELYLIHDEDVLAALPDQADWLVDLLDLTV